MNRQDFLRIIGAGVLVTRTGVPIVNDSPIAEDPFKFIRKLMAERALPGWEYGFTIRPSEGFGHEYTIHLMQNENYHRESSSHLSTEEFNERSQTDMFRRLIYGVNIFNALTRLKRLEIKNIMHDLRH